MSEYQYYEFRAVDRPLTQEQIAEVRKLSTRAEITSTRFANTYNYGDFGGNPEKLMEQYYDAHVYVSNFGIYHLMLRLPQALLGVDAVKPYAVEGVLDYRASGASLVLEWRREEEAPDDWVEGEGWMASLLPIREELARGDYRSLYIGWLRAVQAGYWDDEDYDEDEEGEDLEEDGADPDDDSVIREPPVPPGLKRLTGAQTSLAEFLGIPLSLIQAAAEASVDLRDHKVSQEGLQQWVAGLSEEEVREIVRREVGGEALGVQTELQSRYQRATSASGSPTKSITRRRTGEELLTRSKQITEENKRKAQQEKDRKRREHLASLVPRFPALWEKAEEAASRRIASGYDEARDLLVDLRDAYRQANCSPEFDEAFTRFCARHTSPALKRRLTGARLVK